MTALTKRVAVYVPSTVNVSEQADPALRYQIVSATMRVFAESFGGATATDAQGAYVSATLEYIGQADRVDDFPTLFSVQENGEYLAVYGCERVAPLADESLEVLFNGWHIQPSE